MNSISVAVRTLWDAELVDCWVTYGVAAVDAAKMGGYGVNPVCR